MIRPVEYAKTLDGKLIAVESGPHKGWAFRDAVFATEAEARAADGRSAQKAYLEEQLRDVNSGLDGMICSASPFSEWREKYDDFERQSDLVKDLQEQLFPEWGDRSQAAKCFVDAFLIANSVYEEMRTAAA